MHEWALAQSVITSARKVAEKMGISEVSEVTLGIGELQNIDMEIFKYAILEIKRNEDILKNAKFIHKIVQAVMKCNNCGYEWKYKNSIEQLNEAERENIHFVPETVHIYIHCPKCNSIDFTITNGRGVFIEEIK